MSDKLTETGRRPLRKYETELRELATDIVNRLDEAREEEDGGEQIPLVENAIWNALFGYDATIPVDKRIAGLQRDLAESDKLLDAFVSMTPRSLDLGCLPFARLHDLARAHLDKKAAT